ncbi:toll/interleukin-1 receptor domain-containing protein [Anaerolineales bacterium HSG24]|nr:toll/interleukin-1 receptor domain-containing protein [Anaerolineales bacterium HSG24]
MTILYIEPRPGNGSDYLLNTMLTLQEEGYSPTLIGGGYPPIFVDVAANVDKELVSELVIQDEIEKVKILVEGVCQKDDSKEETDEENGDGKEKNGDKTTVRFCTPEESGNECHSNMTNFEDIAQEIREKLEVLEAQEAKRKEEAAKAAAEKKEGTEEADGENQTDDEDKIDEGQEKYTYEKIITDPQPHEETYEKDLPRLPKKIPLTEKEQKETKINVPDQPTDAYEFDVFLAHNSDDKSNIKIISKKLKANGLTPWLDEEQILAGELFQDKIQAAIPKSRTVAQFIGPDGLGKWQVMELRVFLSQCVDKGIPIIPVLLPGVDDLPDKLLFLEQFNWVEFNNIEDEAPLNKLVIGIKGVRGKPPKTDNVPKNEEPTRKNSVSNQKPDSEGEEVDEDKLLYALGRFTSFELRSLCDKLRVTYSDFKADGKADTAYNILSYYRDNKKLSELEAKAREVNVNYF